MSNSRFRHPHLAPHREAAAKRANREAQARLRALPEAKRRRRLVLFSWEPTDRPRLRAAFTAEGERVGVMCRIAKYATPAGTIATVYVPEGSEPPPRMTRTDFAALGKCRLGEESIHTPRPGRGVNEWRNSVAAFEASITHMVFKEEDEVEGEPVGPVRVYQGEQAIPDDRGPGWMTLEHAERLAATLGVPLRIG